MWISEVSEPLDLGQNFLRNGIRRRAELGWVLTQNSQGSLKEMKKEKEKRRRKTRLMRGELRIHAPDPGKHKRLI